MQTGRDFVKSAEVYLINQHDCQYYYPNNCINTAFYISTENLPVRPAHREVLLDLSVYILLIKMALLNFTRSALEDELY